MSGISELFAEIGNDNICYQLLHTSMTDIKTKKKDSAVTFLTQQITPNEVMAKLVLWFGLIAIFTLMLLRRFPERSDL